MALLATHVFAVRPTGAIARNVIGAAARLLHWLAPIEVSPIDPPRIESGPTTLSPRAADLLWNTDASTPLVVVNLNQSREVARYEGGSAPEAGMSGEEAYGLYGRNTLPHLFRRGGRPLVIGDHVELLVGDPRHPLSADWNSFALVYYPTRMALRHMVTDPDWRKGVRDRTAGLERAAVVPGTPWPEYAPR
jgi:uncharacterized protein (DUF1330 family)